MSSYEKLKNYLVENSISFEEIHHEPVRTSEEAAKVRGDISLSQGAKALIVKVKFKGETEKRFVMFVLPGDKKFDSKKVKANLNLSDMRFATEEEVVNLTNVLPGGVPPFGNLWGFVVYVDSSLFNNEIIAFNAGDKSISFLMSSRDYKKLLNPHISSLC